MRADRLLSILMLLQSHGRMTANELSRELEVSERTIYRDMDALSAAGIPVYGEAGPEGGFALVDSYRTSLTGLTAAELQALFMFTLTQPLAELGISQELRKALLKLSAALPDERREVEEQMRGRFHLDSAGWKHGDELTPYLRIIYQAVRQDRKLVLKYRPMYLVELERLVDPYGLVAKVGVWYLVCAANDRLHVHRVSDLTDVCLLDETFNRPVGFDLASMWREWCAGREKSRVSYPVTLRVAPGFIRHLPFYLGDEVRENLAQAGPPDPQGWITMVFHFNSLESARERLLNFGRSVEVLAPIPLRKSLLDYAQQIVTLYSERTEVKK